MCGIAGVIKKGGGEKELQEIIEKMNLAHSRRGPDDRGFMISESANLVFGHTRLSFQDLSSAGHQPMKYRKRFKNNDTWITFNGEIYNFLELRDELEKKGYRFSTKSDTEVILCAYEEWGVLSFSKFRGMFAFGLWDGTQNKLYLVKDRYGIKPLYYYSGSEKFIFASTVKAIKSSGMIDVQKNETAAIGFLIFGSIPMPQTSVKNIHGIPSGHYLVRDLSGNENLVKYYDPLDYFYKESFSGGQSDYLSNVAVKIRTLLEDSVRLHMISDAPLGVFLSGGVDSSVLSILASKISKNPLATLSITFNEKKYTEKKYQELISKQIKSDHREFNISKDDFEKSLADVWDAMDEPTIDGVNTYFVAKAAKEAGIKAVLSGLGGDEIFFGYQSFKKANFFRQTQKFNLFTKLPLSLLGKLGGRYSKLNYLKENNPLNFYLSLRGLFAPSEAAKILNISQKDIYDYIGNISESYGLSSGDINKLQPANLLSYLELKFYLQNQLLKDSDFMAMHHSVEIRVPFLDHVLVEYLSSLSANLKLGGKYKKQLLIDAVGSGLPEMIYNRPKMGFTFPFQEWLSSSSASSQVTQTHWSRTWALQVAEKLL